MAFKLIGDGSLWSSVAITTLNLTNTYPALPDSFSIKPRDLILQTEAGYTHGYNMGIPQRTFALSLRLLPFSDYRDVLDALEVIGARHWVFWEHWSGTATAGTTTQIQASSSGMSPEQLSNDYFKSMLAIIKSTTDTLAPQGEKRRVSIYTETAGTAVWTVATAFTATVQSGDTFTIGWPVRLVEAATKQALGAGTYNIDFTFEEVVLDGTE